MTRRPLALLVPTLAVSVLLSGCWALNPGADPVVEQTISQEIDVAAIEQAMLAILPGAETGLEVSDETGTANPSFGSDWSEVDHDASRVARVSRGLTSAGWADASGPGFYAVFEVVRMESMLDADGALHDISTIASEPYSLPAEVGFPTTEYEAVRTPNHSDWPTGSIERDVRLVWDDGSRAFGWIVYSASGSYAALVWGGAVPDDASQAAMAAFFDEHLPGFISGFRGLA
jgi:hypothetical protein